MTGRRVHVRRAVNSDAPVIRAILEDSFADYVARSGIALPVSAFLDDIGAIERDIATIRVFVASVEVRDRSANYIKTCSTNSVDAGNANYVDTGCANFVDVGNANYVDVGTVRLELREGGPAYMKKFGVVTRYCGNGIGAALMKAVDEVIINSGVKALELFTASKNADIMRFYYTHGFYAASTSLERGYIRARMRKDYE